MTIKTDPDNNGDHDVEEGEIFVVPDSSTAVDGSIPMVAAVPVDGVVPPPYNPSYSGTTNNNSSGGCVTTTTVTPTTSYIDQAQSHQVQQDEELAMRIQQQQQQSALRPEPVLHSSVQVQQGPSPPPPPPQQQIQTSPPGLPPHGRWVHLTSVGPTTWTVCTIISVISCFFICLPCGLWALLCPCDEERVYLLDNKLFNDRGQMITANARTRRYRG